MSNSTNQFGDACLDPAKGYALRRNARTVSFEDRAGEHIELIRTRRDGQAGWVAVTGDKFDGRFFPTVSGGAGVDLWFRSVGTTWASTSSWSTTASSGGSAGVAPAATDRAIFDAGSAACSIGAAAVCRSLDCTAGTGNYASTISGASSLTIGDATAPTGNVQLLIRGIWTATGNVTINNTGNATNTMDANGNTLGAQIQFSFTNGTIRLVAAATAGTAITKAGAGTLDTNGKALTSTTTMSFTSGTLTCGASLLTCHGSSLAVTPTTLNSGTSEFVMDAISTVTFTGTGKSFYKVTRTGTAVKTDILSIVGDFTVTNTFSMGGNAVAGSNGNRLLVQSSALGTARTVTMTGATFTMTGDTDFSDITVSGAPTFSNTSSCLVGDAQGNSTYLTCTTDGGTNGTARATQTYAGGANSWSTVAAWTSRIPLPQDDVTINTTTAGTLTNDMPRMGRNLNFTGFTRTFVTSGATNSLYGSLTYVNTMTSGTSGNSVTLAGRSNYTVTTGGISLQHTFTVAAPTGTYTLADSLSCARSGTTVGVTAGTLSDGGQNVTTTLASAGGILSMTGGTLNASGTWNCQITSAVTFWNVTGGTVNASSSTIALTAATANTRTFAGGGQTYGTLTYTVAASTGQLTVTGANTFTAINVGTSRTLVLPASTTTTVTGANGIGGIAGTINSSSSGTAATISLTSPFVSVMRAVTVKDVTVTPAGHAYALDASVSTSGNTGITFNTPFGWGIAA